MDPSLARARELFAALPHHSPTIHVAGTNGKGSVTAILEAILCEAGYRTGRLNTPHLLTVYDTIRISGRKIIPAAYNAARARAIAADVSGQASVFESLIATAICAFEDAQVDVTILEVGLGGLLDPTNALPDGVVVACGVTHIDLDHQDRLGETVELIARHKAGIAKQGVPCVVARQTYDGVYKVIGEVVKDHGGKLVLVPDGCVVGVSTPPTGEFPPKGQAVVVKREGQPDLEARLSLLGAHQLDNAALAINIIDQLAQHNPVFSRIGSEHIQKGLGSVRWPGRLQWTSYPSPDERVAPVPLLIDGAHNPDAANALAAYLDSLQPATGPRPRRYLVVTFGDSRSLELCRHFVKSLIGEGDKVAVVEHTVPHGMPWAKPTKAEILAEEVCKVAGSSGDVKIFGTELDEALKWICHAEERPPFVVVTGRLYLVTDVFRLLDLEV